MRNKLIKYYVAVVYLFSTSLLLAQPGTDTTDGGTVDGADAPVAPIDAYIWVLLVIGLVFAFYTFRVIQNQKKR